MNRLFLTRASYLVPELEMGNINCGFGRIVKRSSTRNIYFRERIYYTMKHLYQALIFNCAV